MYDSGGNPIQYSYEHSDGVNGTFFQPCTIRLVLSQGVCMEDILNGTDEEKLGGNIEMYINDTYYGKTNTLAVSSSSIGFANPLDSPAQPDNNLMNGWGARHVISYQRASSGQNATRCQFICWAGTEDIVEEIMWGVEV